jgi:hypothetical protein
MIKIKLAVVDEPGRGPRKVFAIMIQMQVKQYRPYGPADFSFFVS